MNIVSVILTAFLPAVLWTCIILKRKIPGSWITVMFFASAFSILPALIAQRFLHSLFNMIVEKQAEGIRIFFHRFMIAALAEEGVKTAVFKLTAARILKIRNNSAYKKDGLIKEYAAFGAIRSEGAFQYSLFLALFFGLVFGGFENISYNLRYPQFQLLRLCTSVVLHGALGSFYVQIINAKTKKHAAAYFTAAVFLHSMYNFFALLGKWFMLPAAAVIGLTCLYAIRTYTLHNK